MNKKISKWITDKDFEELTPINVFHKEHDESAAIGHRGDLMNRHMLIRKKFSCGQIFDDACICITADDYYKLYINGTFVGQGPAPAYHFRYNWNKYDISHLLKQGENIIAVHVYYQGLINRVWNSGDYRMGVTASIISQNNVLLATDETWKYETAREFIGKTPFGYDTQFVEDIDNGKKIFGWKNAEFDDSDWPYVRVKKNIDYTFCVYPAPTLQIYKIMLSDIKMISRDNYIIDFGHEITGRLLLSANGKAGDIIKLGYGEELVDVTKVRSNMRCNCNYNEKWILSGANDELEQYDYKAFRYVQINSEHAAIDTLSIAAEVRHYPFDDTACKFESSSGLLNKIWNICRNSVKYGTQEAFLDCPSREKGQYLGDATITAQAHAYLTGEYTLFKKCLSDFALSSFICPGLMATAPGSWMQEIADYSLQWPMLLLKFYYLSGDIGFLKEMLPTAQEIIRYFKQFTRSDGLIENFRDKPILVDWPSNARDDYDYRLMPEYQDGCNTVLNAFYIGAVETVNKIEQILGIQYDRDEFEKLKDIFIQKFYDADNRLFVDSESSKHSSLHANALALFFKLTPCESSVNDIVEFIKKKRLSCGVYFSYFVLKALSGAGEYDFVFELLTSDDKHSWGNMVAEGATACFEAWGKEQKWNTSLCHPWGSSPIIILTEDIAGITISEPGWKSVDFKPNFPKSLDFMKIEIPTPAGKVFVKWEGGKYYTGECL